MSLNKVKAAGGRRWKLGLPLALVLAAGGIAYSFATPDAGQAAEKGAQSNMFAASYTANVEAAPNPVSIQSARIDYARIDQRMARLMDQQDMVGLSVGIVEDGRISFVKGYGETVAGSGDPVTAKTVFRWASLSKGVAATVVTELAQEGKLSLDAPVSQMRTSLRLPGGAESRVTIADLLSHRTGIVKNAYDDRLEDGEDPKTIRASLGLLPSYCAPASCYTYQNIAFDASTEIVQRVTGLDYGEVVREKLFAPLGMASASVGRAGIESAASWARPHASQRELPMKDAYYSVPAAGGVNSSIFDLAKWMRAQMGAVPSVLSGKALQTLHMPRVATPPHGGRGAADRALTDATYGLGWRDFKYMGHALIGHRGAVDGYRSLILFDPQAKTGIVMLWNSNSNRPVGAQLELFDMFYGLPAFDWMGLDKLAPGGGAGQLPIAR